MTIIFKKNVYFTKLCPFFMTDGRNERVNITTRTSIAIKVVIRSYFRPEVYKLYHFHCLTQVTAAEREVGERGGGGGASTPRQSDTPENTYHSKYEALTQCCSTNGPTSSPRVNWVWSQPISKLQTLTQC